MKKYGILLIVITGIILIGIIYLNSIQSKQTATRVISAYDEIFEIQKKVDEEISNYKKDKQYTLEEPKIIKNPYKIAPLTALIIFQTPEEVEIEIKVNDVTMTTMEKSKEHSIPIYGMYADF